MKKITFLMAMMFFAMTSAIYAQTITGTVNDETGPLPGANVLVKGTTNGTQTDFDGKFSLKVSEGSGTVVISFVGYAGKQVSYTVAAGETKDLGTIMLVSDNTLDEVVIVGSGVIDLAEDRKTPIAVTTIGAVEIAEKGGNLDLPEVLKETPSVQTAKGGGYGDAQMTLRGFDQTNTAFLLNGQPINGMEDGKMYWSNWSGILDIASAIQVQRGLGSSKLAISSVGGTVNIVTKTVDKKQGGFVNGMYGNDNYLKGSAYYSTGLMDNGLAVSAMFGHWQGDGYRNGTMGQGQTYYLSFGYKANDNNIFNFLITGAPQDHGDSWTVDLQTYLDKGRKFNNMYGYKGGKEFPAARNFYHKPVANLSWDWTISDNSSLSTVAYASWGRGGYYYPTGSLWGKRSGEDGGFDFDAQIAENTANGLAKGYLRGSYNGHQWYGLLTNFNNKINDNLSFNVGADYRYYNGEHFRAPTVLLGGSGVENTSTFSGTYIVDNVYGGFNPWSAVFNWNDSPKQRVAYDYEEVISYIGGFGQLEYSNDKFSAFFQGSVSNQSYQKEDSYNFATVEKSEKVSKIGYNVKGGVAYQIAENQKIFGNVGYYSRQPFLDDIFSNIRKNNELIKPDVDNQNITGFELGYALDNERFDMNINLYHTTWGNRTQSRTDNSDPTNPINFILRGIEQTHKGIEVDFKYDVTEWAKLRGFVSLGDWNYGKNVTARVYDDNANDITSSFSGANKPTLYLKDRKVGGAAQTTAGWSIKLRGAENLWFDLSQRYYGNNYSSVNPARNYSIFSKEDNLGPIKLPGYSLLDAGVSYKLYLNKDDKKQNLKFRVNVNNLTDKFYIEFSNGSKRPTDSSNSWYGVDTSNNVEIGFGLTWNASVRYSF